MSAFKSRLVMEPIDNGRRWKLTKPLVYDSDLAGRIIVPRTFECDLNSIPRLLWGISPKTDYPEAGVIHDWATPVTCPASWPIRSTGKLSSCSG